MSLIISAIIIVVMYYMCQYVFGRKPAVDDYYRDARTRETVRVIKVERGIVTYQNLNGVKSTMRVDKFMEDFDYDYI